MEMKVTVKCALCGGRCDGGNETRKMEVSARCHWTRGRALMALVGLGNKCIQK